MDMSYMKLKLLDIKTKCEWVSECIVVMDGCMLFD